MAWKKSQIQLGETIIVLVFVTILLVIGGAFYYGYAKSESEKRDIESTREYSQAKFFYLISLPELKCHKKATETFNCIDYYKAVKFSEMLSHTNFYDELVGYSNFSITLVYPDPPAGMSANVVVWDNIPDLYDSGKDYMLESYVYFVSIYDVTTDVYYFGYATVSFAYAK